MVLTGVTGTSTITKLDLSDEGAQKITLLPNQFGTLTSISGDADDTIYVSGAVSSSVSVSSLSTVGNIDITGVTGAAIEESKTFTLGLDSGDSGTAQNIYMTYAQATENGTDKAYVVTGGSTDVLYVTGEATTGYVLDKSDNGWGFGTIDASAVATSTANANGSIRLLTTQSNTTLIGGSGDDWIGTLGKSGEQYVGYAAQTTGDSLIGGKGCDQIVGGSIKNDTTTTTIEMWAGEKDGTDSVVTSSSHNGWGQYVYDGYIVESTNESSKWATMLKSANTLEAFGNNAKMHMSQIKDVIMMQGDDGTGTETEDQVVGTAVESLTVYNFDYGTDMFWLHDCKTQKYSTDLTAAQLTAEVKDSDDKSLGTPITFAKSDSKVTMTINWEAMAGLNELDWVTSFTKGTTVTFDYTTDADYAYSSSLKQFTDVSDASACVVALFGVEAGSSAGDGE